MNFRIIFISLIASLGILIPQAKSAEEFLDLQCLSDINTKYPEFSNWKWMTKEHLLEHIVPFKREVYKNVLSQFSSIIESN